MPQLHCNKVCQQGRVTRALGPITNVFLPVPDDFDVVAWTQGQSS